MLGEGGAHGRDDVVVAVLVGHHGVHVAFHDDGAMLPHGFLGEVHCVEDSRFVEHRGAWSVEVFRRSVRVKGAAAESGDAGLPVPDGDHQAAAEKVIAPAIIGFSCQGSPNYQVIVVAGLPEMR